MAQAVAAGLEDRGGCGALCGKGRAGAGEVGAWGLKALEAGGGGAGLQRNGKRRTARTSRQNFNPLTSACQSARTAGSSG